jgi:hypothetical protein
MVWGEPPPRITLPQTGVQKWALHYVASLKS